MGSRKNIKGNIAEIVISTFIILFAGMFAGKIIIGLVVSVILHIIGNIYPALNEDIIINLCDKYSFAMIVILLALYTWLFKNKRLEEVYYYKYNGRRNKILMLAAGFLTGFLLCAAMVAVPLIKGDIKLQFNGSGFIIILLAFLATCVQAGAEEIALRGYMYGRTGQDYTEKTAIILNSILFAFVHINNPGINLLGGINIMLIGLIFSLVYSMARSLAFVCGMHIMWNFTEEVILGLPDSGIVFNMPVFKLVQSRQTLFYDERFGIEASVQVTLLFAVLVVFIVYKYFIMNTVSSKIKHR